MVVASNVTDLNGNFISGTDEVAQLRHPIVVGSSIRMDTTGYPATYPMPDWAASSWLAGAMTNGDWRWDALTRQKNAWTAWISKYGLPEGFYISHEANLSVWANYDWSMYVSVGWEAFLVQSVRDAWQLAPGVPVWWSPFAYDRYTTMAPYARNKVAAETARVMQTVHRWLRTSDNIPTQGINLVLQDGVGAGAARGIAAIDAVGWCHAITTAGWPCAVNVERFVTYDQQTFKKADPAEVGRRIAVYKKAGIPIGPSWELRYAL